MRQNRLQNKVAESEMLLPVCVMAAVAMWWLPQRSVDTVHVGGLLLCLLTAYIVTETNTRQHVIRIRTRMMSGVWLLLSASLAFMHPFGRPLLGAALLSLSYLLLFRSYQRRRPQLDVFHAFLMLGLGSFVAPVMLFMAVPFFFYVGIFLRSLTRRAFWAGVLGIVLPYWCYGGWCLATGCVPELLERLREMVRLEMPSVEAIVAMPLVWQVSAAVVALFSIVGIVHYLRTNFDDKIRVRMYLYIYMSQTLLLMAYLVLQPSHYETTMGLLVASASPLVAHYFSLSRTVLTTVFFFVALLLTAGMAVLNLV